jgi:alpha-tubulin suppressor-like RCC1 family protein
MEIYDTIKIKKISCGGSHSLGLTRTGEIFSWGFGEEVKFN